jgi:3-deoxy-D-manno-octulosonic-acid transferase
MRKLYSFFTSLSDIVLGVTPLFSKKMKLLVNGRRKTFKVLSSQIETGDKTIWFHCASLGEFEQGLPIMKALRQQYADYKLVLTFFSPSGYEVKKNDPVADVIVYLPSDTIGHCRKFLDLVHPQLAVFVKYEFWPNFLFELESRGIHSILISGLFRKDQPFFAPHGGFMRKALKTFDRLFVQDQRSVDLLGGIGLTNVTLSGDTRFDRVSRQLGQDNTIEGIGGFIGDRLCVVCGSTWPEDDEILVPFINKAPEESCFIIAPHVTEPSKVAALKKKIGKPSVLFSQYNPKIEATVLIIDSVGLLSRLYSYADLAYVGGAMGNSGLHNILEPATFGVPIVIGRNYEKFPEAIRLESLAGLFSVANADELAEMFNRLIGDKELRRETGLICEHYIASNTGATRKVLEYLAQLHANGLI